MLLGRSPRALLAAAAAAVAALVAVLSLAGDLAAIHRRAGEAGDEVPVVVAAHDLALGQRVEAADLRLTRRYERRLPDATLRSLDDAVGRTVATPVLAGHVVAQGHLAPRQRRGLDGVVPPGGRIVRITVEGGLRPEPGSVVDVLVTFDSGLVPDGGDATMTVVGGALVVAGEPAGDDVGLDRVAVSLLTDVDGAHRLAFAAAHGIVTLTLAPPEEACCPTSSRTPSSASSRG